MASCKRPARGATTIRECIRAGFLDELQLHLVHILPGDGTSLFRDLDPASLALERTQLIDTDTGVTHLSFRVERPD